MSGWMAKNHFCVAFVLKAQSRLCPPLFVVWRRECDSGVLVKEGTSGVWIDGVMGRTMYMSFHSQTVV
jgi:hypothetical protein